MQRESAATATATAIARRTRDRAALRLSAEPHWRALTAMPRRLRRSWPLFLFSLLRFNKLSDAAAACQSIGSVLATAAQLESAWALGGEWCHCAAVSSGQWSFPMHKNLPGCGSTLSVFKGCAAGGATCYGRKPRKGSIAGLLPFSPTSYHAPGVTPPGPPNYGDNEGQRARTDSRRGRADGRTDAGSGGLACVLTCALMSLCACICLSLSSPPAAVFYYSPQYGAEKNTRAARSATGSPQQPGGQQPPPPLHRAASRLPHHTFPPCLCCLRVCVCVRVCVCCSCC